MKKQVFLLLILSSLVTLAQKKKLPLIIKEGEELDLDNSKIIPGAAWEIVTVNYETKKYFL